MKKQIVLGKYDVFPYFLAYDVDSVCEDGSVELAGGFKGYTLKAGSVIKVIDADIAEPLLKMVETLKRSREETIAAMNKQYLSSIRSILELD